MNIFEFYSSKYLTWILDVGTILQMKSKFLNMALPFKIFIHLPEKAYLLQMLVSSKNLAMIKSKCKFEAPCFCYSHPRNRL